MKAAGWLIALSLGLSIIGRTVSRYQNDAAFGDWVEGGDLGGLVGRHLVYGDYDTALDFLLLGCQPAGGWSMSPFQIAA